MCTKVSKLNIHFLLVMTLLALVQCGVKRPPQASDDEAGPHSEFDETKKNK